MNSGRLTVRLAQIGAASVAIGALGYDALQWFPIGLENVTPAMIALLGISAAGIICIALAAAIKASASPVRLCMTWGSWLVAGSMVFGIAVPLNMLIAPLVLAPLVSGLLLLLTGAVRIGSRRIRAF